jgi:hypothetical protein
MQEPDLTHGDTEPRGPLVWLWLRRATLAGLAVSVMIHLVALLIAAVFTVHYGGGDAGGSAGQAVDFAIMSEAELSAATDDATRVSATHAPDLAAPSLEDIELASEQSGGEIDALMDELVDVDISTGGGDISGGSLDAAASGGGGLSGAGASFFGVEAQGSRFAYIVDVSTSMNSDGKMDQTKRELARSIGSLSETAEATVVLYATGPTALTGQVEWSRTDARGKIQLRRKIMEIQAGGSTNPLGAFEWVFRMKPTPDAIYFMTDGEFDEEVVAAVKQMNRGPTIPVHCIMFGQVGNASKRAAVEQRLRQIARDSGGLFKHVGSGP